jgi:uncharacterized protein Yka (UPF0111/DUF47 family)
MTIATPLHRTGLALTLSAVLSEIEHLQRELHPFEDDGDYICRASDVTLKCDLEEIKKHADRISNICGAEIDSMVRRINRHATLQAAE